MSFRHSSSVSTGVIIFKKLLFLEKNNRLKFALKCSKQANKQGIKCHIALCTQKDRSNFYLIASVSATYMNHQSEDACYIS